MTFSEADNSRNLQRQLGLGLEQMDLALSEIDQSRLVQYVTTLHKWNKTHNLTAIRDPEQMIRRHVLDSLSIAKHLRGQTLLDVGSGAGLPGIPLALVNPHLNVTLLDSVLKKTRFMLFAARQLELGNVTVEHARVEALSNNLGFDMIVARAFSSIDKLCALGGHLLADGGQIMAMIGKPVETDNPPVINRAQVVGDDSEFSVINSEKLFVPGETAQRNIVILQKGAS